MTNKNTVLILGPTPPPMGGIATYVGDLLKSGINDEYNVLYLDTTRDYSIKKSLIKNLLLFLKNKFKLIYLLSFKRPKIVHIHTSSYMAFWEKSIFLIVSKLFFTKVIMHIHGGGFSEFYQNTRIPLTKSLIRFFLNISDRIIVLSNGWNDFFAEIVNKNKIIVIPNGVYSDLYLPDNVLKSKNGFIHILFAGYLAKEKGIYDILDSIPHVLQKHNNARFVFAGIEEKLGEFDKIKKYASELNIDNNTFFLGMLSKQEMVDTYKKSNIFILPSYIEGLPISILEAMAAGLPIISTPVGGIPEVIVDGENGFLITPGDSLELANKIIELIGSLKLRMMMGEFNQEKIRNNYDWKIIANQISDEYNKLLE
ncbi:Glycosyltransferase involved in cell wall bisynthesis [Methanococcoides vulcani]|uniref:Glycosyltransferase involved in cell wall bisynthesis n=1 Tax=Methanococcoides vulcani TaxID=1353158 RepID=A0A1H9Z789_9EURY|nr:glycosyltransferase family 4 protein [Methanococcoides vulcani]SES77323.1 Glycosyltransferase involved in cell wall bisynthesis [Methanococcoides vulcani]